MHGMLTLYNGRLWRVHAFPTPFPAAQRFYCWRDVRDQCSCRREACDALCSLAACYLKSDNNERKGDAGN